MVTINTKLKLNIKKKHTKNKQNQIKNHIKNDIKKHTKTISILSYNISWESMTGSVSKWPLCSNNSNKNNPKHYSVCVNNITEVINNTNTNTNSTTKSTTTNSTTNSTLDFITLQEATNYDKLIEQSPVLRKMEYEKHISGLDTIITFYKPIYNLLYTIKGKFELGRPWMATIYDNGICLINVHMGHYSKETEYFKLDTMLFTIKNYIMKHDNIKNVKRYIISGDFNYNIKNIGKKNKLFINGIKFYYHSKHILTCCIKRTTHFDHVIDSLNNPIDIQIPNVKYMASDHKPIIVKLVK